MLAYCYQAQKTSSSQRHESPYIRRYLEQAERYSNNVWPIRGCQGCHRARAGAFHSSLFLLPRPLPLGSPSGLRVTYYQAEGEWARETQPTIETQPSSMLVPPVSLISYTSSDIQLRFSSPGRLSLYSIMSITLHCCYSTSLPHLVSHQQSCMAAVLIWIVFVSIYLNNLMIILYTFIL